MENEFTDQVVYIGGATDNGRIDHISQTPQWAPTIVTLKASDSTLLQSMRITVDGVGTESDPANHMVIAHLRQYKNPNVVG